MLVFRNVSFFFFLLSSTVNKTVEQEKLFKMKTNIVGTFFERFQCGLVSVSGTNPMHVKWHKVSFFENNLILVTKFIVCSGNHFTEGGRQKVGAWSAALAVSC